MGVYNYGNVAAELVPFSRSTFDLIRNESRIAIFDFKNDLVCILDQTTPATGFVGTVQQAIDAGIITFSRASNAAVVGPDGKLTYAGPNVWRRQYDPLTLEPLGYLPEPARTNALVYSEQFDNAAWAQVRAGVDPNQIAAPDGAVSADKLIEDTTLGNSHAIARNFTATGGQSYVLSAFFKAGSAGRYASVSLGDAAFSTRRTIIVDLIAGAVVGGEGAAVGGVIPYGNGWYRVWAVATAISTTAAVLRLTPTPSTTTIVYDGDGTSFVYVWGAQLEVGAYPTSYIPTGATTVTRNADVMYADLTKLPFDPAAGSVIAFAQQSLDGRGAGPNLWSINNSNDQNRIVMRGNSVVTMNLGFITGGVGGASINRSGFIAGRFGVGGAFATDDAEIVAAGGNATASVGALPADLAYLRLGYTLGSSSQWGVPVESIILVPRRLATAEMNGWGV